MSGYKMKQLAWVALGEIDRAAETCDEVDCQDTVEEMGAEVAEEFAGAAEALRALRRELEETIKAVQEAVKAADGLAEELEENGEDGEKE